MSGKAKCEFKNVRVDVLDPWLVSEMLDKVLTPVTVQNVIRDVTMMSKSWTRDRQLRREAMVKELRATEQKRSKLYSVLELMGKDAPNLGDIGPRLRELSDQLKTLEQGIIKLEEEPAGPEELSGCDPELVAELLRSMVSDSDNPKKQRTFMASFIEKATVSGDTVAVYYNEGRLMSLGGSTVRSDGKWLLNLGSNQGPTD